MRGTILSALHMPPWSGIRLEKGTGIPLPLPLPFMVPEGSLTCSQWPATGPYPKPDAFSLHVRMPLP
jgi:hypothetical protein